MNAQMLGFSRDDEADARRFLGAAFGDDAADLLRVAMDLARFVKVELTDAVDALGQAMIGRPSGLRRLGFDLPANCPADAALAMVRERSAGAATAYAKTYFGRIDAINASRS